MEKQLEKYFNFSQFRPGQKEIVESILAGRDVVALMPTGGGKSLCYQLPAILSEKITVVISPLIALMKDQVDSLQVRGIPATFINSSLAPDEVAKRIHDLRLGKTKILYIAPERFGSGEFRAIFSALDVFLFAIDEAHCVSQWGHDFRPDYLEIRKHIQSLRNRPVVAAFTATATPEVKEDIVERLELRDPKIFIRGFDRPNLKFFVQQNLRPKERMVEVLRIAQSMSAGAGIIYALSRKEVENIAKYLSRNGISAAAYHAGMAAEKRTAIQNDFMENEFQIIVATIAFGMGVDKADVRFVIHAGMPGSLEGYYQEAGRAGRDGEVAYCILLHSKKDSSMHKYFIRMNKSAMAEQGKSWEEMGEVIGIKYERLGKIEEYVMSKTCRRNLILKYFGDPDFANRQQNCRGCDVCLDWKGAVKKKEFTQARLAVGKDERELSGTVSETVRLYKQKYSPAQIAKMRSLGVSTIFNHLVEWYLVGGSFRVEEFLAPAEEAAIAQAIAREGGYQKLSPLKSQLPDAISYEKIRMAIAKLQWEKRK